MLPLMEHNGVRYELLETVNPPGWKWVARISPIKQAAGFSASKELAVHAAKRAIEKALEAEKRRRESRFDGTKKIRSNL
jgi:hypothetical protein